jgi:hypothetical protein
MGFRRTTLQSVEHSDGFVVRTGGRFGFQYVEGDHVASIYSDPGPPASAIYRRTLTGWDPPFDDEAFTDEKREQILGRIIAGLDFLEVPYEIVTDK